MGKKSKKFSSGSSYHIVLRVGFEGCELQSSDLFVDNLEGAREFFTKMIKEYVPGIGKSDIENCLDEGYCQYDSGTVMLIEPETVHVGEQHYAKIRSYSRENYDLFRYY